MKKKLNLKITAVICLIFMILLLIMTVFRSKGRESYQENRKLAEIPKLSLSAVCDGSYFKEIGEYFSDHFAGRSHWISFKGTADAEIGESIVNGVYISDNMLLDTIEHEIKNMDKCAELINDYAEDYGGRVFLVAVPSSSGVYSNMLPEYIEFSEQRQISELYAMLDNGIRTIDAYNILKMLNDNYIYYRNDSRWTSYGAYCVYRTVIQKLGFLPIAYDKYTIEHVTGDFRGNLYNQTQYTGVKADMLDVYDYNEGAEIVSFMGYDIDGSKFEKSLYDKSYIGSNDMYGFYMGKEVPFVRIKTTVNNNKKLLVIKDSYADCFIPFLIQHYSEIAVVSPKCFRESNAVLSRLIDKESYAQTLFLFGAEQFPDPETLSIINK